MSSLTTNLKVGIALMLEREKIIEHIEVNKKTMKRLINESGRPCKYDSGHWFMDYKLVKNNAIPDDTWYIKI